MIPLDAGAAIRSGTEICRTHGISNPALVRSPHGENVILFVNDDLVLKIFAPERNQFQRELAALSALGTSPAVAAPRVVAAGEHDGSQYLLMTRLAGERLAGLWPTLDFAQREPLVRQIGSLMRELHTVRVDASAVDRDWSEYVADRVAEAVARQKRCGVPPQWLDELQWYLQRVDLVASSADAHVFLHGDIHPGNLLVRPAGKSWEIAGIIDFADCFRGPGEYEFVAPGVLMVQGDARLQRILFESYGYSAASLDSELRLRLMLMTILYECSDLRKYALRLRPDAVQLSLPELGRAIWAFAD